MVEINKEHLKVQQLDPSQQLPESLHRLLTRIHQTDLNNNNTSENLETFLTRAKEQLTEGEIYTATYKDTMLGVIAIYPEQKGHQHPYFSKKDVVQVSSLYLCEMTDTKIVAEAMLEVIERFSKYLGKRSLAILLDTSDQKQKQYFQNQGFMPSYIEEVGEVAPSLLMVKHLKIKKVLEMI